MTAGHKQECRAAVPPQQRMSQQEVLRVWRAGGNDIRLMHAQNTACTDYMDHAWCAHCLSGEPAGPTFGRAEARRGCRAGKVRIGQQADGLCSLRSYKRRRRMVAGLHGEAHNQHRAMWYPQQRCCRSAAQPLLWQSRKVQQHGPLLMRNRAKGKQWSSQ